MDDRVAALRDERTRVQTEQLECVDRIAELQAELADLERIAAPRDDRARVEAALRAANEQAAKLDERERALTSRLERVATGTRGAPLDEDRLALVERVLAICTRAQGRLRRVAHLYTELRFHPLVELERRLPGLPIELRDPEQVRRDLFDALYAARKEMRAVVDAFADIATLYPASKAMLGEDMLENLAAAPILETVEQTPLARQASSIVYQLAMVCRALGDERQRLEDG